MKRRLKLDLQLFSDETGVEVAPAAEVSDEPQYESSETGAEHEVVAEPEKNEGFEKAFAKRLAAKEAELEAKFAEKYKDYDTHKELSQYMQELNGVDALTLKEQIELQRLQDRAEKEQVPPEVLKRLDELEERAKKGDELEQQQIKQQNDNLFWSHADKFVADKDVSKEDLNKFMIENDIFVDLSNEESVNRKFELAYKAMQHDNLLQKLGSAEKDGMKKLIQAKGNIATVPGKSAQGQVISSAPKTWAEARARAMQRGNGE